MRKSVAEDKEAKIHMTRAQQYIDILLDHIPKWELQDYEHREIYDKIKNLLITTENLREKLKELYKVKGYADFALSLLWITDKVENDESLQHPTREEEELVFRCFRKAVGEEETSIPPSESEPLSEQLTSSVSEEHVLPLQEISNVPSSSTDDIWGWTQEPSIDSKKGVSKEEDFARLLEQFLEAVQSGSDNRFALLGNLRQHCQAMRVAESDPVALEFYTNLHDFLEYVEMNQYVDDIRVINLTANIQEPYTTWVKASPELRVGILEPATEILRNFKEMFE